MDEGRKRVIGIMAAILAARKLAQYDGGEELVVSWSNAGPRLADQVRAFVRFHS